MAEQGLAVVIIEVLLLIIGTLIVALQTASLFRSGALKASIIELTAELKKHGEQLHNLALTVARDYMTHEQHQRHHDSHG